MELLTNQISNKKLCMTVKEMSEELGIGINTAYQLSNSKGFPVIRIGERKKLIPVEGLKRWLLKQAKQVEEIKDDQAETRINGG